jgi:hypothetical protein
MTETEPETAGPRAALAFRRIPYSPFSLGLVANFVSLWPPFDHYEFGIMMTSLRYQLEHQTHVAADLDDRLVAYLGWLKTSRTIAEAWLKDDGALKPATFDADAVAVTILATQSAEHILPMLREAKRVSGGVPVYWKRYYVDGRPTMKRAVVKKA